MALSTTGLALVLPIGPMPAQSTADLLQVITSLAEQLTRANETVGLFTSDQKRH